MQQIPEKIDSKFRFVLLASKRAELIMRGAQPKVVRPGAKYTRVAMEEVFDEAIAWDYGPEEVAEDSLIDGADASSQDSAEAEES